MGTDDDRDLLPPLRRSEFDVVRRGYDRTQVDEAVEAMQAELQILNADRDATTSQAAALARQLESSRREIDDLREQLRRLSQPPTTTEGMSERVKRMLHQAQDEAAETRARAESDAAQIKAKADKDGASLRGRYEKMIADVDSRRAEMETEHQKVLSDARRRAANMLRESEQRCNELKSGAQRVLSDGRRRANDMLRESEQRCAKLESEADGKRAQAEEDFEITMAARRNETMHAIAEQEATSKSEAQRRVTEATEQAERQVAEAAETARRTLSEAKQRSTAMVDDAHRRVEQLRTVRHQVAEQLLATRSMLDQAFRHLAPPLEKEAVAAKGQPDSGASASDSDADADGAAQQTESSKKTSASTGRTTR